MTASTDSPLSVHLQMRSFATDLVLPPGTDILRASEPEAIGDVRSAVFAALAAPIGSPSLAELCREAIARTAPGAPSVAVVVSDNTRPVPYRGDGGILWPLVEALLSAGIPAASITLLVASGTHRVLSEDEMWALYDERAREAGVRVQCHDAADDAGLVHVGRSARGAEVYVNRTYVDADLRILTGLVEPHLMAGASGGRKSICPGLLNVQSVRDFHGPKTLVHPLATDLVLDGNPCHEVSLQIARMAPPDLILNVTMRQDGRVAGIFAGDMEKAHLVAFGHMRSFVQIPLKRKYDVVVTHAGHVGINHYQAEKAIAVAAKAVVDGGYLVVVADTTDSDPVGTKSYRRLLELLAEVGAEEFLRRIMADDWEFVHDQWGAQVWAQLLVKVPCEHVFYFSPQTPPDLYPILACVDPRPLLAGSPAREWGDGGLGDEVGSKAGKTVAHFVTAAVAGACRQAEATSGRRAAVAYLADGPHGIPAGP